MADTQYGIDRRRMIIGAAASAALLPFASAAQAQGLGLGSILGNASDNALNKLSAPNGYYNDEDVRIGLPFIGKPKGLFGSLLGAADRLGITGGLTRTINDAASAAAGEAKPIFRSAINDISFSDVPGIVRESTGGTQYLRRSANDDLHAKLRPLIDSALGDFGAFRQLDSLSQQHSFIRQAGLSRDGMSKTVTDQGLDGIFTYMGREESSLRDNPADTVGKILKGIF